MQELYNSRNGAVSTIYLSGIPGCGKSQLARQIGEEFYSARSRDTEGLVFVATLNTETLESLADSYLTLAANLSIPLCVIKELGKSKTNKPKETLDQAVRMVRQRISMFSNWLIIADNVVDLKSVRSYFPQTASKEWGHGQVLITAQDSDTIASLKNLIPFVIPDRVVSWLRFTADACLELSDPSYAERLSQLACDLLQCISMGTQGSLLRSQVLQTRGSLLHRMCDFNSALSCQQGPLDIRIKLYGEEHGAVAASYKNLGVVCRNIGQDDQAKEFYKKALNIQVKLYGEEHGDVAKSYNNLGVVCSNIGQHDQAKESHEKALDIRIKLYGEESGDVAASYNNMGVVCRNIEQHDQAKEFHEKALNIKIKLYGEEHGDVAASYNNLGVVCRSIGQHEQAKAFHEKALNIQIKLYGEGHGDVAARYNNLGLVCSNIGQHDQAKEFYEKALNIQIKLDGEEHGAVA